MVHGQHNGVDQIADVHEVALYRLAVGIEHERNRSTLEVFVGTFGSNQVTPSRSAEYVLTE